MSIILVNSNLIESARAQNLRHLRALSPTNFETDGAARMRQPRQIRGDSAVRIEAISAPVERQHRVEVNDLGRQIRDFRVGYIRRVGDDQIEISRSERLSSPLEPQRIAQKARNEPDSAASERRQRAKYPRRSRKRQDARRVRRIGLRQIQRRDRECEAASPSWSSEGQAPH